MNIEITQTQKFLLGQRMTQSLSILQMNGIQLESFLQRECEENPVLSYHREKGSGAAGEWNADCSAELNGMGTLTAFLMEQIGELRLTGRDAALLRYLCLCLDRRGYLPEPLPQVAVRMNVSNQEAERLLAILQGLEPDGVGARDLGECLRIQMRKHGEHSVLAMQLTEHLQELAFGEMKQLARSLDTTVSAVRRAKEHLRFLNPIPSNGFAAEEQTNYICADLLIEETDNKVVLNDSLRACVDIDYAYAEKIAAEDNSKEVRKYLAEKIHAAEFLQHALAQRESTLQRCAECIAKKQLLWLSGRAEAPSPLTMTEVAQALRVHPSTVSRAVRDKYFRCAQGLFPLSFLLPQNAVRREAILRGEAVSAGGIKALLAGFLAAEPQNAPLSDQQLLSCLKENGIEISRRAIANYRLQMNIPASYIRARQRAEQGGLTE